MPWRHEPKPFAVAGADFEFVEVEDRLAADAEVLDLDILDRVAGVPASDEGNGAAWINRHSRGSPSS